MPPKPKRTKPRTAAERMRAHRQRLRAQGLRPVQHWVPDLRNSTRARPNSARSDASRPTSGGRRDRHLAQGRSRGNGDRLRRGDVVIAVMQGDMGKPRPAVVVQSDELGPDRLIVVVCPMSSQAAGAATLRPIVEPTSTNGLLVSSQIMTDKITAVPRERLRRVLGRSAERPREAGWRAALGAGALALTTICDSTPSLKSGLELK